MLNTNSAVSQINIKAKFFYTILKLKYTKYT